MIFKCMEVNIKTEKPPAWILEAVNKQFVLNKGTIFTYDRTIYNPEGVELPFHLVVHELTHVSQQHRKGYPDIGIPAMTPDAWWKQYLDDPHFRLSQEAEAYGQQYKAICEKMKDRNARARELHYLAEMLSSAQYGNLIPLFEASHLIKQNSLKKIT